MLAVIDYGGGNLGSLLAALDRRGAAFTVTCDPATLSRASAAIFPGDGAFGATMAALRANGLDRAIVELAATGKPFLGICVGMQILFERSVEFGESRGLGILRGTVSRLENAPRVPHIGWNRIEKIADHPFVAGLEPRDYAYFMHSYRVEPGPDTVAVTTHGDRFAAIAARANVMGTQFHPEKSRRTGARLLENFLHIVKESNG